MKIATLKYMDKTTSYNMSDTVNNPGAQHFNANRRVFSGRLSIADCFRPVSLFFCLLLFGLATQPVLANRIQVENAKVGNPEWRIDDQNIAKNNEIEGYTFPASVNSNNTINFYVNSTNDQTYNLTIYRLGWYNGAGARQMQAPITRTSIRQVLPAPDPTTTTGLIEANWRNPYQLVIPANWLSGIYVALLKGNQSGLHRYIPFVVTNDGRNSKYLFQSANTTWQAYNGWGGKSLYSSSSLGGPARKVSFNRPYQEGAGMGQLDKWEINMLRFLEREGADVTYQTDTDTDEGDGGLLNHKALLSVGHDEYWTKKMRDNIENARNHGLSLGFFGANASYWQIRLESSGTGQAKRTIVGYKGFALTEDPYALDLNPNNDNRITVRWREAPVNRPENSLIGIMHTTDPVDADIVVSDAANWIYTGTGLRNGDKLAGLLGYEIDSYVNNGQAPVNTQIIATSPDPLNSASIGNMSVYTRGCPSAYWYFCSNKIATVFATGSMQWNWGLDNYGFRNLENDKAKQITRNALARMVNPSALVPAVSQQLQ